MVLVSEMKHQMPNSFMYITMVSEDTLADWHLLFSVCVKNKDVLTGLLEYLASFMISFAIMSYAYQQFLIIFTFGSVHSGL